jgi:hypothetical protein
MTWAQVAVCWIFIASLFNINFVYILLYCRLVRYLYPTDEQLRALAGVPKDRTKGKKGWRNVENGKTAETFHIPRNLDIEVCL